MAYSTQDILNQMATLSGQGLSNADVIAQLGTMGISPMQAVDAYSTRSDLFAQTDEIMQGLTLGDPTATQAWVDRNNANPEYQALVQMQDYARQFEPPPPDPALTGYFAAPSGEITTGLVSGASNHQFDTNYGGGYARDDGYDSSGNFVGWYPNSFQEVRPTDAYTTSGATPTLMTGVPGGGTPGASQPGATGGALGVLPTGMSSVTPNPLSGYQDQAGFGWSPGGNYSLSGGSASTGTSNGGTWAAMPGASGSAGGYGSNPYLSNMANEIGRRTQQGLGDAFNQIRSNAISVGGLGGSRQGVAEGVATRGAMDSMQGNLANLFGQDWTNTQNRGLQQYGIDTNAALGNQGQLLNYDLGLGGLQNQRYGMDQNYNLGLGGLQNQRYGMDQNYNLGLGSQALTNQGQQLGFYNTQRQLDQSGLALGANLYANGIGGEWSPIQNAADIYKPFSGMGGSETASSSNGGGALGALGGLWGGAKFGKDMGWWG